MPWPPVKLAMLPTVLLATALAVVLQVAEQLEMLWKGNH